MQASNLFMLRKKRIVIRKELLDFAFAADFLELGSHLVGVFLGQTFLDGLRASRNGFDEVLGFLQAQAGQSTDDLDDSDLVRAAFLRP